MAVLVQTPTATGAFWRDPRIRSIAFQVAVTVALAAFFAYIIHNTATNLAKRDIASGFGFLGNAAGFDISITIVPYELTSSYGRAFLVGLVNTLLVSAVGIVLATLLGFFIGVLRLSRNWLIATLATIYVETLRNIPLLVQCFFWYFAVLGTLSDPKEILAAGDVVFMNLNTQGFFTAAVVAEPGFLALPIALIVGIGATMWLRRWAKRRQEQTGERFPVLRTGLLLILGLPVLAALLTGLPWSMDYPTMGRFGLKGGWVILPEFIGIVIALTLYTAAFIAENVRSGILAVSHGQTEAAYALGLRPGLTTRLVVIPQAMRVIVPPLTSQFLNLTKNSSLGVAIAYPDLVHVFAGTVQNQTGQAVECITLTMLVYLVISLTISAVMNWYNRSLALVER